MVYPAMNTLQFWFDKATRRKLHGTPEDCARKFSMLMKRFDWKGIELFLTPSRLETFPGFQSDFIKKFRNLVFRSVHIGDSDTEFLDRPNAPKELAALHHILNLLETDQIIIHAHHLQKNMLQRSRLLEHCLPGTKILIENNGFDAAWGWRPHEVLEILTQAPDFGFCLDIAHVEDFQSLCLDDFLSLPALRDRIRELHVSVSTHLMETDPYVAKGFPGYGPFHALFSVLDQTPSPDLVNQIGNVPIVIEGVVPKESPGLDFLIKEKALFSEQ